MLAMAAGLALVLVPAASATVSPFVWTGNASEPAWSSSSNWGEGSAPSSSEPVTLEFPRIPFCSGTCYKSENDVSGLTAESIKLDNGDEYVLRGKEITLGGGGLTASPASESSGASGDVIDLPVQLGASQTWSIAGRSGGGLGENGAAVLGNLAGSSSSALTFEISNEALLYLSNETEVGPVTIVGADPNEAGIFNGFVEYFGELNFSDKEPVSLSHIFLIGSGAFGALSTNHAALDIGSATYPAEGIVADSATFASGSEVGVQITGSGDTAGEDYSQLESAGPIELGSSKLLVNVLPPEAGKACPSLRRGQTYTFVSTTGKLSGSFANAPAGGPEIEIGFAKSCDESSRPMRISYDTTGATETVTGTVEAAAKEKELRELHEEEERHVAQEAKEHKEAQERQEATEHREAQEREATKQREETTDALKHAAEALATATQQREQEAVAAAKKRQEEEAAATRKHEEELAKIGVLAAKEESKPKPLTRAQRLAKALKSCSKETKKKRARCEALARKKYGSRAKSRKGAGR
jgi:hypothetical protein